MKMKRILQCLLIAVAALATSLPVQAGMVGTAQMQTFPYDIDFANVTQQRAWITEQLVKGGVSETDAEKRVASMTDVQVTEIYQRIDELPAGASAVEVIIIIGLVLVITELLGYTDIIPNWPDKK
jgi:hypothetical protein